jgi:hypothetical protein
MSGPDIAGLVVSVVVVAGRVTLSMDEFRRRMNQRSAWLENQIRLCMSWKGILEYIGIKIDANEHLIDPGGLVLMVPELHSAKAALESLEGSLSTLHQMSDRYPWDRLYAQWRLDERRPLLEGDIVVISTSFNNVNALLGLATK